MRKDRPLKSTPELDRLEMNWWNENASTIEKIWAQSYALQRAIRLPYLKKAKSFFSPHHEKCKIWEVGCGSGWVCRLIADEQISVVGTDFSQAQIDLANESASNFGKSRFLKYVLADATTRIEGHQGILIHALLHHLSQEELDSFFKLIQDQKSGTKVFIYEPTFIQQKNDDGRLLALAFKQVIRIHRYLSHKIIDLISPSKSGLEKQVETLFEKAEQQDWFLSPKEVPFYEDELNSYLQKYFTIHRSFFVNYTELDIAQYLMVNDIEYPNFLFTHFLIPIAALLDRIFFKLNFRSVSAGQYFYQCFELTVK